MKQWIVAISLTVGMLVALTASADDWQLKEATDFSVLSKQSKKDNLPIAIYFNMSKINASKRLKEMAILPMIENGILDGYVHMVQVTVDVPDEK
ncbi:MAG: hypothetical protein R3219_07005, partial [Hydrogenovibrio sp.]|nr:hypothetical protein [Hydrogenovibrio sp.]